MPLFNTRPLDIRLKVAIIADAAMGGFPRVDPGSTFERMRISLFSESGAMHPYEKMWLRVSGFNDANNWNDLSYNSLDRLLNEIAANGSHELRAPMEKSGTTLETKVAVATKEMVAAAAQRWSEYGWINYEERKRDKISGSSKFARRAALFGGALVGIDLFTDSQS